MVRFRHAHRRAYDQYQILCIRPLDLKSQSMYHRISPRLGARDRRTEGHPILHGARAAWLDQADAKPNYLRWFGVQVYHVDRNTDRAFSLRLSVRLLSRAAYPRDPSPVIQL